MRRFVPLVGVLLVVALCFLLLRGGTSREAYYHAASAIEDKHALGGFGPSNNAPRDLAGQDWGARDAVSLLAFPDEPTNCHGRPGFVVRLVNRTTEPAGFVACDSCLYLAQEARTAAGAWRAFETTPEPICGNSFHRVILKPNQYWEFAAARSTGVVPTKLRFRLDQGQLRRDERMADTEFRDMLFAEPGGPLLYSNEFDGHTSGALFLLAP